MAETNKNLVEPYAYYLVAANSVTHRVLNDAEQAAEGLFNKFDRIAKFANEKKLEMAIGWVDETPVPVLLRKRDSVIDGSITSLRDQIAERDQIAGSMVKANAYFPSCTGQKGGVCCDWKKAAIELKAFLPYKNIENAIVAAATEEQVPVPSPAHNAVLSLGNINIRAKAYKVFADWIFQAPVNPANGNRFIPPQAQEISRAEVEERTMGILLSEYRGTHRTLWPAVRGLKQIDLC